MAMLTMLFDGGIAGDLREQLLISLQDQIDNVVGPKMARNMAVENGRTEGMGDRGALRNVSRLVDRAGRMGRVEPEEAEKPVPRTTQPVSGGHRESRGGTTTSVLWRGKLRLRNRRHRQSESIRDAEFIKRGWSRWQPAVRKTEAVMKTGSGT